MIQTEHKIADAVFNIEFSSSNEVINATGVLPELIKEHLVPCMNEVFDQWGPDQGVLRIQNLSVDLGTVAYEEMSKTLTHRLRQSLQTALHDRLPADHTFGGKSRGYISSHQAGLDLMAHFLKTGTLPWTAEKATQADLCHVLVNLIDRAPQALITFLRHQTQRSNVVLRRLVRQFKPEILVPLAAYQAPSVAPALARLVNLTIGLYDADKPALFSGRELAHGLWEEILGQLLSSPGGNIHIPPCTMVVNALEAVAEKHRISHHLMFQSLIRVWRQRHSKASEPNSEALIGEILNRVDAGQVNPKNGHSDADQWASLESILLDAVLHHRMDKFSRAWSVMRYDYPEPTRQLIRKIARRSRVRQSIAHHFTPHQFRQLVILLEPRHANFVNNVMDHQNTLEQAIPRMTGTPEAMGARIRDFTLSYLLSDSTGLFNRKQYCTAMIRSMAARHNMDYRALLEDIYSFFSSTVQSNDDTDRQFREILDDIRGNPVDKKFIIAQDNKDGEQKEIDPSLQLPAGIGHADVQPSFATDVAAVILEKTGHVPGYMSAPLKDMDFAISDLLSDGTVRIDRMGYFSAKSRRMAVRRHLAYEALLGKIQCFFSSAVQSNAPIGRQLKKILGNIGSVPVLTRQAYKDRVWKSYEIWPRQPAHLGKADTQTACAIILAAVLNKAHKRSPVQKSIQCKDFLALLYPIIMELQRTWAQFYLPQTHAQTGSASMTHIPPRSSDTGRLWVAGIFPTAKNLWMDANVWSDLSEKVPRIFPAFNSPSLTDVARKGMDTRHRQLTGVFNPHALGLKPGCSDPALSRHPNHYPANPPSATRALTAFHGLGREPLAKRNRTGDGFAPKQTRRHLSKRPISVSSKTSSVVEPRISNEKNMPPVSVYVENAGIVLAAPYLPRLFSMLGYMEKNQFKNPAVIQRAVHIIEFLVHGRTQSPEFRLTLNKILCGVSRTTPICSRIDITAQESHAVHSLMIGIISHWKILGNTSPEGLRTSFLQRQGYLSVTEDAWHLRIEPRSFDMLLDQLPWSITMIKHPWMPRMLNVNWRT